MTPHNLTDFDQRRAAALAILAQGDGLNRKSGGFLGQISADPSPLTDKQLNWLLSLAGHAGVAVEA